MIKYWRLAILTGFSTACFADEAGQLDPSFKQPAFVTKNSQFSYVHQVETTQGGKLLIQGSFLRVANVERHNLARLNEDGSLDTTFAASKDLHLESLGAVLREGKVVMKSFIKTKNESGTPVIHPIVRLNSNGTLDESFERSYGGPVTSLYGTRFAARLDGGLICHFIPSLQRQQAQEKLEVRKLNPDGSVDKEFNFICPDQAKSLSLGQIDHKGRFLVNMHMRGEPKEWISELTRVAPDGSQDVNFKTHYAKGTLLNCTYINEYRIYPNGDVLFMMVNLNNTINSWKLMRMSAEGIIDESFLSPESAEAGVSNFTLQEDGKIICLQSVGGNRFDTRATHVYRLNSDGRIDPAFPRKIAKRVGWHGVTLQADGKILLYGDTMISSNQGEPIMIRLLNDPAVDELRVVDEKSVRWKRGGSAPAVTQTLFDLSVDEGRTWQMLGYGAWSKEGWKLEGLELPSAGMVRASGQATSSGSSGLVEQTVKFSFEKH